jgi:hypothetical protein
MRTQGVFFRRVLLLIVEIALLTSGGAVAWGRRTADASHCFTLSANTQRLVLDSVSARWFSGVTQGAPVTDSVSLSPDGQYAARVQWTADGAFALRIARHTSGALMSAAPPLAVHPLPSANRVGLPQWSPDSRRVIVPWGEDGWTYTRLLLLTVPSGVATDAPLDSALFAMYISFSADGHYAVLRDAFLEQKLTFHVFTLPTMQQIVLKAPSTAYGSPLPYWSPSGHWLMWLESDGVGQAATQLWLNVVSPEASGKRFLLPIEPSQVAALVAASSPSRPEVLVRWSQRQPDGEMRVVVVYHDPVLRVVSVGLQGDIRHELALEPNVVRPISIAEGNMGRFVASPDGTRLLYLRTTRSTVDALNRELWLGDLTVYDLIERRETVILRDVVAADGSGGVSMLHGFDAALGRIIVPTWGGDSFALHLLRTDGAVVRTLVEGATEAFVLSERSFRTYYRPPPFLSGDEWVTFFWRNAHDQVRLLWAKTDGSDVQQVAIRDRSWTEARLVSYDPLTHLLAIEQAYDGEPDESAIAAVHLPSGTITPLMDRQRGSWLPIMVFTQAVPRTPRFSESSREWLALWREQGRAPTDSPTAPPLKVIELHQMVDGRTVRLVTSADVAAVSGGSEASVAHVAPDQRHLLIVLQHSLGTELALLEVATSAVLWREAMGHLDVIAQWSPDSAKVITISRAPNTSTLTIDVRSVTGALLSRSIHPTPVEEAYSSWRWTDCG